MSASSPELTGGSGFTYEAQVVALYLVDLLLGGEVRALAGASALRVQLQRKALAAPLDDLVVIARRDDGRSPELHLQIKRTLQISAARSNTDFREIVHAVWDTLNAPTFPRGISRVGVATEYVATDRHRAVQRLHEGALNAHDAAEFQARMEIPGLYGVAERDVAAAVAQLLQEHIARPPTAEELWQFWRHFLVVKFETTGEDSAPRHAAVQNLRFGLTDEAAHRARDLLNALEGIAHDATIASFDLDALIERLAGRFPLRSRQAGEEGLEALTRRVRVDAARHLEGFTRRQDPILVELGLEQEIDGERQIISHSGLVAVLREGSHVVLQAEPGAGKSTTLVQLAGRILGEAADRIPLLARLPQVASAHRPILQAFAAESAFQGVAWGEWLTLARAGRLVLVLDAWNELTADQRTLARVELERFEREFPGNAVLIATRPEARVPLQEARRVELTSLTTMQQQALLATQRGAEADALLRSARSDASLSEVLSIPLYLRAVASTRPGEEIRVTREGIIARFVDTQETRPIHQESLERVLAGTHDVLLQNIASALTDAGTTSLAETDLRSIIARASARLVAEGQLGAPLKPREVIETLVAHHILVERDDLFSFQHQQFQEWYASFEVERWIRRAGTTVPRAPHDKLDRLLDRPAWEESVLFAIERLSRADDDVALVARTVQRVLGIDPLFAAEMLHRSTDAVWAAVAAPVCNFIDAWSAGPAADRAFSFMLMSGRAEFADPIWKILEDPEAYRRVLDQRRLGRIVPSVFGQNWDGRFRKLGRAAKRRLLWDVAWDTGPAGREFVIEAVRADPSADVISSALEILHPEESPDARVEVLSHAPAESWTALAQRYSIDSMPNEHFAGRMREEKQRLAAETSDPALKLRLLIELDVEQHPAVSPEELIALALQTKFADHHMERHWLSRIADRYPEIFAAAVLHALTQDHRIPYAAAELIRPNESIDAKRLSAIVLDGKVHRHSREIAARLLEPAAVRSLIEEALTLREHFDAHRGASPEEVRTRYPLVNDALAHLPLTTLVDAVLTVPATHPRQMSVLADTLTRWRDEDRDREELPLDQATQRRLSERLTHWVDAATAHAEVSRYQLHLLASSIGRLKGPELLQPLKRLLDKELEIWREQRKVRDLALKEGRRLPPEFEGSTSYVDAYGRIFESLDGDGVRDVLLSYLDTPEFAVEAAFALRRFGGRPGAGDKTSILSHPNFDVVLERRQARLAERERPPHAVATEILDRVDTALVVNEPKSIEYAVRLATAAALTDFGNRASTLEAALNAPGSMQPRYGLLLNLVLAGEPIRAAHLLQGLDETYAQLAKSAWSPNDRWWMVERWYELLAFTENPGAMLPYLAQPTSLLEYPREIDGIAAALARAGTPQAIETLLKLPEVLPGCETEYAWLNALAQVGTKAAAERLTAILWAPKDPRALTKVAYHFSQVLSPLLGQYPAIRKEMIASLRKPHGAESRAVAARALAEIADAEDTVELLSIVRDTGNDPLREALFDAAENIVLAKVPMEQDSNAYHIMPAEAAALRARLYAIASPLATRLLMRIDRIRDEYGRPPDEVRHPNLSSGTPWPREAPW